MFNKQIPFKSKVLLLNKMTKVKKTGIPQGTIIVPLLSNPLNYFAIKAIQLNIFCLNLASFINMKIYHPNIIKDTCQRQSKRIFSASSKIIQILLGAYKSLPELLMPYKIKMQSRLCRYRHVSVWLWKMRKEKQLANSILRTVMNVGLW